MTILKLTDAFRRASVVLLREHGQIEEEGVVEEQDDC